MNKEKLKEQLEPFIEKGSLLSVVFGVLDYVCILMLNLIDSNIFIYCLFGFTLFGIICGVFGFFSSKKRMAAIGLSLNLIWIFAVFLAYAAVIKQQSL